MMKLWLWSMVRLDSNPHMSDSITISFSPEPTRLCQEDVQHWGLQKYFSLVIKDFSIVGETIRDVMEITDKDKPGKGHLPQRVTPSSSFKHFRKSVKIGPSNQCFCQVSENIHTPWMGGDGVIG